MIYYILPRSYLYSGVHTQFSSVPHRTFDYELHKIQQHVCLYNEIERPSFPHCPDTHKGHAPQTENIIKTKLDTLPQFSMFYDQKQLKGLEHKHV